MNKKSKIKKPIVYKIVNYITETEKTVTKEQYDLIMNNLKSITFIIVKSIDGAQFKIIPLISKQLKE